ncbi:MAG: cytochrome c oxidase assembly protein [Actinobacteria bacterium]|nr:cytochrome c oxidase assembly protein [Actinomycetota bacterium]
MSPAATWTLEPAVLLGVAATACLYLRRWRQVAAEPGPGRRPGSGRAASFLTGLALVLLALVSPIDRLADQLFFVHMVQHVLLLDLVPILLISGLTRVILRPVTRRVQHLERALGPLGDPVFAIVLYVAAVWAWHVPALYDAALSHPGIHVLEHTTYAVAGGLYWWHLLSPIRSRRRLAGMGPALYMAATKLLVGLLGIVLVFAPGALYAFYAHQGGYWGLSAHSDQELAGGTMALEQSLVMGVALAVLFARMLSESEREAQRAERAEEREREREAGGGGGGGDPAAAAPDPG